MDRLFRTILDWSEVWAPLIPLAYFLFHRKQPTWLKPVIIYLIIALFINLAGDIVGDFKAWLPPQFHSNTPLYNIHSVIRFVCFSYFFMALGQTDFKKFRRLLPLISLIIIIPNFIFREKFFNTEHLSGYLLTTEAYILLVYCILYYLSKLREDGADITVGADFWVVTGLSIYVVVNFFVFLFYVPMIDQNPRLADSIWDVHNVSFILLCIFITKALHESARNQFAV